jgi:8-oxo-dGTP pyrophosphatase MutT (NUDIX family)
MVKKLRKAGGILIKDRKLLVEKSVNKDFYIAPGGKIKDGETTKQALIRELNEEFGITVDENDLEEFGVFEQHAVGYENVLVKMDVFRVNMWVGTPMPNSEVEKVLWINSNIPNNI